MFSAAEVFDVAIRIEENGERFYRDAIASVSDLSLKELLRWNADEEMQHREHFIRMKKKVRLVENADLADQMGGFILQNAVSDHAFSLEDADFSALSDEDALLRTAIGFEEDSLTFYEILESFVTEPDALREVHRIMDEERKHIALLEERRRKISRQAPEQISSNI